MTTLNNKLALIEPSEYAPGIYYAKPEPIIIEGLDDLIAKASAEIDQYFTDDAINAITDAEFKDAKAIRAGLNKRAQAVDNRRKEIKGYYQEVLTPFELQINKLRDTYKTAGDRLGVRIKEIEDARKSELRRRAATYYRDLVPVLDGVLPYDKIAEDSWHNLSFGEVAAQIEIDKKVDKIVSDIAAIESSCGEWVEQCKVAYFDTLDLSKAFAEKSRLEDIAERTRRMDREREEIRVAQEEHADEMAAQEAEVAEATAEPVGDWTTSDVKEPAIEVPRAAAPTHPSVLASFTLRFSGPRSDLQELMSDLKQLINSYENVQFVQVRVGAYEMKEQV